MMTVSHKVGLVVDRRFGTRIIDVAHAFHVWVVESPANDPVIRQTWHGWRANADDPLEAGITSFSADASASPEEVCAQFAEDVDEHHGQFSHDPPWSEFEVFGAPLTERLREIFEGLGAMTFEVTKDGFIARR